MTNTVNNSVIYDDHIRIQTKVYFFYIFANVKRNLKYNLVQCLKYWFCPGKNIITTCTEKQYK